MRSEAGNFPDIAAFYHQEVVEPSQSLIRRILQRGIDRGEFKKMDLDYAVFGIISPMVFMMLAKHFAVTCIRDAASMDPKKYIASQLQIILYGMGAGTLQTRNPSVKHRHQHGHGHERE